MGSITSEENPLYSEVGNYFSLQTKLHDVFFIVGDEKERIGAVRQLLINQSEVWWTMLSEDSAMVEKGDISLPDIEPDVFNLLLKHCYGGLEDCSDLSENTMMKLCYCADKYLMASLLRKIADRLQPKRVNELFPALHCMVYYNLRGVEKYVRKIVQTQTNRIFEHPDFLEADVDSISYIAQQDTLGCKELELWQAIVEWAKNRAKSDEGPKLRRWLEQPLQHIRFHTLEISDLMDHVFSLNILESIEISNICKGNLNKPIRFRSENKLKRPMCDSPTFTEVIFSVKQNIGDTNQHYTTSSHSCSCIVVDNKDIHLQNIVCRGHVSNFHFESCKEYFFGIKFKVTISVTVTRFTNLMKNIPSEEPIKITHRNFACNLFDRFSIPVIVNGKGVLLRANSNYKIELKFTDPEDFGKLPCWSRPDCVDGHEFEHGTFYCSLHYNNGIGVTPCHILQFNYHVADD